MRLWCLSAVADLFGTLDVGEDTSLEHFGQKYEEDPSGDAAAAAEAAQRSVAYITLVLQEMLQEVEAELWSVAGGRARGAGNV